jgi:5'-nucleotidase
MLGFNAGRDAELVEVVLASRNTGSTGLRVGRSIDALGLPVQRRLFTGGGAVAPYLRAMGVGLFLSTNREDVYSATADGIPAAVVLPGGGEDAEGDDELRVAFDGDCCLFGAEAQTHFEREGLDSFNRHEEESAHVPLSRGPMAGFLMALGALRQEGCRISTALVTARCAPADARVIRTMMAWGVETDALFALGGEPKAPFLRAFRADFFFDDQEKHAAPASKVVPSALTLLAG